MQGENYHARFPNGFFGDEFEKLLRMSKSSQPLTITLTLEKLDAVIEDMLAFCKYIDEHLPAA
jgi:hypothetical protein